MDQKKHDKAQGANPDTKMLIYNTAMNLFFEKGYNAVKVSDICNECDVAIGTFYYHYKSKGAILHDYNYYIEDEIEEKSRILKNADPESRIRMLFLFKLESMSRFGIDLCRMSMAAAYQLDEKAKSTKEFPMFDTASFMQDLEAGKQAGNFDAKLDTEAAAGLLRYMLVGIYTNWLVHADTLDWRKEAEKGLDYFFSLIRNE